MDLNIPDIDGIGLLQYMKDQQAQSEVILMSGVEDRILESAQSFANSIGITIAGRFQKTIRLSDFELLLKAWTTPKIAKVEQASEKHEFLVTREELLRGIQNNEFVTFYQPKIDIASRGFYGVEALVRWNHPVHKITYPDNFIPQTESLGLMNELTWLIIRNAIKEISWLQEQIQFPFKLGLNLSPGSLEDQSCSKQLIDIIDEYSIPAENIIIEITESGLMDELSSALAIFTRLRLKNIHLSIDDFGTGYAMMQQLKLIPATELKIDKSFVQNMLIDNSARVTVQKVIEIGHELGMKVVAEGVETKEHLQWLQRYHCDIAQGYYFSKPIPLVELQQWISTNYKLD